MLSTAQALAASDVAEKHKRRSLGGPTAVLWVEQWTCCFNPECHVAHVILSAEIWSCCRHASR